MKITRRRLLSGIDVPLDMGFQYREPPQDNAFMKPEEYDQLAPGQPGAAGASPDTRVGAAGE